MVILYRLLVLAAVVTSAHASSGDRSREFQICVNGCDILNCQPGSPSSPLPLALRITRWTCVDDCMYHCMHQITDRDVDNGTPVQQYHGKWPFRRFAGMQEPASVAFSLLNLWAHVRGARKVLKRVHDSHPMKNIYFTWSVVSSIAWVWSAVSHTRGEWPPPHGPLHA
jgi:post-GPI attachment to proteins factor 3